MREGGRVRLIADFARPDCAVVPGGTCGLLGVCEGNLGHVLFDGIGAAIIPVALLVDESSPESINPARRSPTNVKLSVHPSTVDGFTFTSETTPLLRIADGAEFQKGYPTTIAKVVDNGDTLEVHLVVPMIRLKERPWWAPKPAHAYTMEELRSSVSMTFEATFPPYRGA